MPHAGMPNRAQVCINWLEDFGENPWGRGQAIGEACMLVVLSFPFKQGISDPPRLWGWNSMRL